MKLFTEKELAAELGLSPWTIRNWRLQLGMPHIRTAGRIFYRQESVVAWMDKQENLDGKEATQVGGYGQIRKIK